MFAPQVDAEAEASECEEDSAIDEEDNSVNNIFLVEEYDPTRVPTDPFQIDLLQREVRR